MAPQPRKPQVLFSLTSRDSRNFASSLCTFWFSLSKLSTFAWLVLHCVRSCGTSWASNFHVSACWVATSFVFSKSSARRWTLSTRHCSLCFSFVIFSMVLSSSSIWDLLAFLRNTVDQLSCYIYHTSQPIRCTVIFSLEILEKNNDGCIFNFCNLLEENRIVTYQN